ncbi:MAG: PEP-CTERM sorting domain-containing protein [Planctomycetota bacterium]|jgi:hypothetical protein
MEKKNQVVLIFVACLCAFSPLASAAITATSSATDLGTGVWQYTIDLTWSYDPLEAGVSHTDFDISGVFNCPYAVWDELGELTGNVYFDPTPSPVDGLGNPYYETGADGYTNGYDPMGEVYSVGEIIPWTGFLEEAGNGGPILRIEQTIALISPAPHDPYEVWTDGTGTFTYYSVFAPKDLVPDEFGNTGAAVTLKSGGGQNLYTESGYMTGQVPDCTTIPEPATLALLGLGGLLLRRRK